MEEFGKQYFKNDDRHIYFFNSIVQESSECVNCITECDNY